MPRHFISPLLRGVSLALLFLPLHAAAGEASPESAKVKPIRALLVTGGGGGYHDYTKQKDILTKGVSARANVVWTVVHEDGGLDHEISLYSDPDWARGYDVVVHNECFADVDSPAAVERVLKPHRAGVPAVVLHGTVHTYRKLSGDAWHDFLGVKSVRHGPMQPLTVKAGATGSPILRGFPAEWMTGDEELYQIDAVMPRTVPLATAFPSGKSAGQPVFWTNTYGAARVFGSSMPHTNATFSDPVFLDTVTRGLLWACGRLEKSGNPSPGFEARGISRLGPLVDLEAGAGKAAVPERK